MAGPRPLPRGGGARDAAHPDRARAPQQAGKRGGGALRLPLVPDAAVVEGRED
jgi:hypothetical protein